MEERLKPYYRTNQPPLLCVQILKNLQSTTSADQLTMDYGLSNHGLWTDVPSTTQCLPPRAFLIVYVQIGQSM
jgi:hypothetical protein